MKKLCPKCDKILYEAGIISNKGDVALNEHFKKSIIQEKDGLFIICSSCHSKLPAVLISRDGINRIILLEK